MLPVALIADRNGKDCRAPVANKALGARVEDGLAANGLGSRAVDLQLLVVDHIRIHQDLQARRCTK